MVLLSNPVLAFNWMEIRHIRDTRAKGIPLIIHVDLPGTDPNLGYKHTERNI